MPAVSYLHKWALGLGAVSGAIFYYYNANDNTDSWQVHNSWTTNYTPSVKWDHNWDRRDPKSLVKPIQINSENDENKYNEKYEAKKAKAIRHIFLIRHGQYHIDGKTDAEKVLTELGRKQAEATGKRLAELNLPYSLIVRSTMTRALETSKIIEKSLIDVPVEDDSMLIEGAPIPPEPPIGQWRSEKHFFQDGPRIEAAFRKYFHRADPSQEHDSYSILVCHANVIRYFVCRALQFPPEAWLRICLKHGSITWLCILPSGRVTLFCLGDTGYMLPQNAILTYWVSTNFISLVQTSLLKIPYIRKALDMPIAIKHGSSTPGSSLKNKKFIEEFRESWTNMKISKQLADRERADAVQFNAAGKGPIIKTFKYDPTKQKKQSTVLTKSR